MAGEAGEALAALRAATQPGNRVEDSRTGASVPLHEFRGDASGPPSLLSPREVEHFAERGWVAVRGKFAAATIDAVRDELDVCVARTPAAYNGDTDPVLHFAGAQGKNKPIADAQACRAFQTDAVFYGICRDLLPGDRPRLFQEAAAYKHYEPSTRGRFAWHQCVRPVLLQCPLQPS